MLSARGLCDSKGIPETTTVVGSKIKLTLVEVHKELKMCSCRHHNDTNICLAMFLVSLTILWSLGYEGNCKSKTELKYVSECRKFSYCYGLCFWDSWAAVYNTQVIRVISISSVSIDTWFFSSQVTIHVNF